MANLSPVPLPGGHESSRDKAEGNVKNKGDAAAKVSSVGASGPRKLIRPSLPAKTLESRSFLRRTGLVHTPAYRPSPPPLGFSPEVCHAETFYLQKQVQEQTLMHLVLEDGEQIQGYIEWYDRDAIKVRHGSRTLIYKSSIKYIYKAGENSARR